MDGSYNKRAETRIYLEHPVITIFHSKQLVFGFSKAFLVTSSSCAPYIDLNKYDCIVDQKLTDSAACVLGRRCVSIHQLAALCYVK